mgnify:CR=1 FL=1
MSKPFYSGRLSINKEKSSPYWMVTFQGPDGKMRRRSTKVPVNGGEFEGDRITAKLAERLAYQRAVRRRKNIRRTIMYPCVPGATTT